MLTGLVLLIRSKPALNDAYRVANGPGKSRFRYVFDIMNGGITTIIVGDRPAGKSYETTDDGITLYLNIDCVNGSELQDKLTAAVDVMGMKTPEIAKVIVLRRMVSDTHFS